MEAEAVNAESSEKVTVELSEEQVEQLGFLEKDHVSDRRIDQYIDSLDISADAKALLASIMNTTIRVGEKILRIGKRILELVIALVKQFPNTTFGLILGLLVGMLVASIPLLGFVFGALVKPIAILFGLAVGYKEDLLDKALDRKIAEATAIFEPLKGAA